MIPEDNTLSIEDLDSLLNEDNSSETSTDKSQQTKPSSKEKKEDNQDSQERTDNLTNFLNPTPTDSNTPRMGLDLESLNALASSIEQTKKDSDPNPATTKEEKNDREKSSNGKSFLMDVKLKVSVRFGHTEINIKEVSKLKNNSIVNLDDKSNEPVDLFVNEKFFGRGKLVAVDGCYGVKLTEIINNIEV